MDRRREPRVFVDLPVHIWGMDAHCHPFSVPASLRSISGRGATLQGVDVPLKPGEVLDLRYRGTTAQFRVIWLGKPGTEMQGEVGLENLSTHIELWDVDPLRCAAAVGQG
ncbi:MAG TPA: PilZ domain-containing protein [Candidatus Sulfotelmatobacter sp.]|nr:PilZ domain-containing protein [Candidatus Sulfotelmatobacter sp.]